MKGEMLTDRVSDLIEQDVSKTDSMLGRIKTEYLAFPTN